MAETKATPEATPEFDVNSWLDEPVDPDNRAMPPAQPKAEEVETEEEEDETIDDVTDDGADDTDDDADEKDILEKDWLEDDAEEDDTPEDVSEEDANALELINKTLGTNYKTLEEAKAGKTAEPKPETKKEPEQTVKPDANGMFLDEEDTQRWNALQTLKGQDTDKLLLNKLRQETIMAEEYVTDDNGYPIDKDGNRIDPTDPQRFQKYQVDEDLLQDDLEELKSNRRSYIAKKNEVLNLIKRQERDLREKSEAKKQEVEKAESEKAISNRKELQSELKKLSNFMCVNVDPKYLHNSFKKVVSGTFFDEITSSQANMAQMALLWELRNELPAALAESSYNKGKLAMFQNITSTAKPAPSVQRNSKKVAPTGTTTFDPADWGVEAE